MELATLECFVSLPEPEIKVANIKLKPVTDVPIVIVNPGFMQLEREKNAGVVENSNIIISDGEVIIIGTDNTKYILLLKFKISYINGT